MKYITIEQFFSPVKKTPLYSFMSLFSKNNNLSLNSPSTYLSFMESSRRTKLHNLSTNSWLRTRHPETTSLSYLCFPFEREQHNQILEVFQLLDENQLNRINIVDLIRTISKFNGKIPKNSLWKFFHRHDLDRDDALNFEEFKTCALSQKGKLIFSNIIKKVQGKKINEKSPSVPASFNSLITQVSYKSARNDLLKRCCDTSIDINRRANHFFHLFGLQNKFKNPDDYYPDNAKVLGSLQDLRLPDEKNRKYSLGEGSKKNRKESSSYDPIAYNFTNTNEESVVDETIEEVEKIVVDSKMKGEELAERLKNTEQTEILNQINLQELENNGTSPLIGVDSKKWKNIGRKQNKLGKMGKIMNENLKESKKNLASKLFKKIIGIKNLEATEKQRQIKFYPIRVNNRKKSGDSDRINENHRKNLSERDQFELFLPKIQTIMKPIRPSEKLPTFMNIFNEDFKRSKTRKGISEFKI